MDKVERISDPAQLDKSQETSAELSANIDKFWKHDSLPNSTAKLISAELPGLDLTSNNSSAKDASRALDLDNALRNSFYTGDLTSTPKFYAELPQNNHDRTVAAAWDIGQVIEASLSTAPLRHDSSLLHELDQDLKVLNHYWDSKVRVPGYDSSYGPGGDKYYDDNTWIGLAFLDANKQNPNAAYVDRAKQIFNLQVFGTKGTDTFEHPGGVLWTQQRDNMYRAAVSTAGATELAAELFQQTHDKKYLDFAVKEFDWMNANLKSPEGLFYDGMDKNGTLHKEFYPYNQGLMLGDATLLLQATGDQKYLQQAKAIARNSLQAYGAISSDAAHPTDQAVPHLSPFINQMAFFDAVYFKNLMMLDAVAPDPSYRQALSDYSAQLAKTVNPKTGLCEIDGKTNLLDQVSAVQIFALAAEYRPSDHA